MNITNCLPASPRGGIKRAGLGQCRFLRLGRRLRCGFSVEGLCLRDDDLSPSLDLYLGGITDCPVFAGSRNYGGQ